VIIGYARVFTGWNYYQTNQANKRLPNNWNPNSNYTNSMVLVPTHHEAGNRSACSTTSSCRRPKELNPTWPTRISTPIVRETSTWRWTRFSIMRTWGHSSAANSSRGW